MLEPTRPIDLAERPNRPAAASRCSVAGCPCKDVRIVLRRRAAFFAELATRRGETADRIIAPEPGWRLPPHPTV